MTRYCRPQRTTELLIQPRLHLLKKPCSLREQLHISYFSPFVPLHSSARSPPKSSHTLQVLEHFLNQATAYLWHTKPQRITKLPLPGQPRGKAIHQYVHTWNLCSAKCLSHKCARKSVAVTLAKPPANRTVTLHPPQ